MTHPHRGHKTAELLHQICLHRSVTPAIEASLRLLADTLPFLHRLVESQAGCRIA